MQTRLAHYWILLSLSGFVSQIMIKYLCKLFALKNVLIIELGFKIMTINFLSDYFFGLLFKRILSKT